MLTDFIERVGVSTFVDGVIIIVVLMAVIEGLCISAQTHYRRQAQDAQDATEAARPRCSACHGPLPDSAVTRCMHCGEPVVLPMAPEPTPECRPVENVDPAAQTWLQRSHAPSAACDPVEAALAECSKKPQADRPWR